MITLLSNIFIKNRTNRKDPAVRQAYGILCGAVGIFLNLCLFTGKFVAGTVSNSIAITADAFNNLSDAGSSVITLIGFRMAGQKPDPSHPFGHGRIEYISGLLVSVIILLMGAELLKSSVAKIIHPEEQLFSPMIIVILLASILVKCYMFLYNRQLGKKLESAAMAATATDSLSDCLATSAVLVSTLIAHFTGFAIDGWCGVLVGLFICYAGYSAAKDTVSPLLGQAPDREFVRQINDIVMAHENVLGIHDLIVHNYGPGRVLISLHAEVPADGNFLALHDMIDTIEHELRDTLNCHAVIHMDPICVGDEETTRLKALVNGYLQEISERLTMHDFRIVTGPTHTNLIFDVAAPYDFSMTDSELETQLKERILRDNPTYFAVIEIDKQMA
ncbi:cation diffusion facilitator family transporter [Acetatifactor muris]|uniref:Ferrous-iron efflux pump FieF n=1 Tax=Acetatifactor muris TaxID=879566 RepID=A0A2K4ZMZ3_9FIRM|nr:cation diffusion facilitator family transporter [Acetatifactor muris]MCR2050176.1 cation diffusion facilitator family transporter [Acetatifactor muris]SOY31838.1 Ferrous-iron efflux pump FieF [Acetatifactor muris]